MRAQPVAQVAVLDQEGDGVLPVADLVRMSVRGPASRSARSRAPPGVTVQSMVASRLPARSPERVRVSSRLARVAASMASAAPEVSREGGLSAGRLSIWVFST